MTDQLRKKIIRVLACLVVDDVRQRADSRRNFKYFRSPHPSVSPRSGIQTIELPLEDYKAIAILATKLLKAAGYDITVEYDSSDHNRAFVAKLR